MKSLVLALFFLSLSVQAHQPDERDCEANLAPPAQPSPVDPLQEVHLKAYRNGALSEYLLKQGGIASILDSLNGFAQGRQNHTAHEVYFSTVVAKDWTLATKVRILRGLAPKIFAQAMARLKTAADNQQLDSSESFYLSHIAGAMLSEAIQKHDPNEAAVVAKILKQALVLDAYNEGQLNQLVFSRWELATHASDRRRLWPAIQEVVIDDDPQSFTSEAERTAAIALLKKYLKP